jgi:Dolichyl-phosphate-mannose-protein mannosyltransferase
MIPVVLFATALIVRAAVGTAFAGPAYPDSYYYVNVAQSLAAGHGFSIDYIWNFVDVGGLLPSVPTLPIPSNGHWMPLAALVQVPFIWILGPTWLASELPMWIAGALAAPLTYWIAREVGLDKRLALCAGLLAAVPGALTPFFGQPDNFGLFMTLGALALWLCARGLHGHPGSFVLGGLVVGVATLARSDGVLLGVPFAIAFAVELWRRRSPGATRVIGWSAAVGCFALFALVVGPWFYRQIEVFGSIAPSAANGRILWISSYDQLYSVGAPATPATLLDGGIGALVASRVGGLLSALGLFAFLPLTVVLTPFAIVGAWARRRDAWFSPFFVYVIVLFGASGLLFAVHVPHGTFIHSAVALLPHTFVLVLIGVRGVVVWVARRRPWDVERATRIFAAGTVAVAVVGAVVYSSATIGHWSSVRATQAQLAAALDADPAGAPTDVVMSADAGAYSYLSGHPGIVTPFDDLDTIEQAMRDYNVRWLVLERGQIVPALEPVLTGASRPSWLSQPVAVVPGAQSAVATTGPVPTGVPDGAIYAVCLEPSDTRCQ